MPSTFSVDWCLDATKHQQEESPDEEEDEHPTKVDWWTEGGWVLERTHISGFVTVVPTTSAHTTTKGKKAKPKHDKPQVAFLAHYTAGSGPFHAFCWWVQTGDDQWECQRHWRSVGKIPLTEFTMHTQRAEEQPNWAAVVGDKRVLIKTRIPGSGCTLAMYDMSSPDAPLWTQEDLDDFDPVVLSNGNIVTKYQPPRQVIKGVLPIKLPRPERTLWNVDGKEICKVNTQDGGYDDDNSIFQLAGESKFVVATHRKDSWSLLHYHIFDSDTGEYINKDSATSRVYYAGCSGLNVQGGKLVGHQWNTRTRGTIELESPLQPKKPIRKLVGHCEFVRKVMALPDGRLLSYADDSTIRVWNLKRRARQTKTAPKRKATGQSKGPRQKKPKRSAQSDETEQSWDAYTLKQRNSVTRPIAVLGNQDDPMPFTLMRVSKVYDNHTFKGKCLQIVEEEGEATHPKYHLGKEKQYIESLDCIVTPWVKMNKVTKRCENYEELLAKAQICHNRIASS
eukprot:TRINITY_DN21346_c0_g1_i1.p1 TRINITY_DN21346_c0_g1~~TRINITY_DN21346_c0_g1_i1.p1  ORF type:complete len:531 (+),score=46.87 TRINITY_DN21346_c0_g1_i1:74-1594(+)